MSETPVETTPTDELEPAGPDQPDEAVAPPWGDDFDPERAYTTIKNLREREKELSRNQLTPEHRTQLAEWQMLQEISQSDVERAQNAASAAQQQLERFRVRAVESEIKAQAAVDFVKPEAVLRYVDPSTYVDAEGEIDTDSIKADLASLLESDPYLRKTQAPRPPAPNPAQGNTQGAPDAASLIDAAKKRGDWQTVIALENQKLLKP